MHRATRRQLLGAGALGAVAAVAAVTVSPAAVVATLEDLSARPVPFALALVGLFGVRSLFLWPVTGVAVLLGYLYHPGLAVPVALLGATATAVPPFLVARTADATDGLVAQVAAAGEDVVGTVGETRGVVTARLLPIPTDAVSYAAGFADVSVGAFLLGTFLGEAPWMVTSVLAGNSMRTLAATGPRLSPGVLVGVGGLAALVLAGPLYRQYGERVAAALRS